MNKHIGQQSVVFQNPPSVIATASIVGPKEGEGPLHSYFDKVSGDILFGEESWEKAESRFVSETLSLVVEKAGLRLPDIDYILAGDILNQCTGSTFGVRALNRPFYGLFGACSAMGESMGLGAMLIDGGFANYVIASASSHFCSAEKTFRFPLELGSQRPPTSSWTVTGDGACVLAAAGQGPYVTAATTGKVVDMGIKDANNMGAAMAPAAVDTLLAHFEDLNRKPSDYDMIITGDLGYVGHELVVRLMSEKGYDMRENYTDCGIKIFDQATQDTHAGGSGCACSATTFAGYLYNQLKEKRINKLLFIPTGALLSTTTAQQGETIPSIAHAVVVENEIRS